MKYLYWAIGYIVIIALLIYYCIARELKSDLIIANIGTFTSIYALVMTFVQMKAVLLKAEETDKIINKTMQRYDQLLSLEDIAKYIEIAKNITKDINSDKYEIAQLKLENLKEVILKLKKTDIIDEKIQSQYNNTLIKASENLSSLNDCFAKNSSINKIKFSQNSEVIVTFLIELKIKISKPQNK